MGEEAEREAAGADKPYDSWWPTGDQFPCYQLYIFQQTCPGLLTTASTTIKLLEVVVASTAAVAPATRRPPGTRILEPGHAATLARLPPPAQLPPEAPRQPRGASWSQQPAGVAAAVDFFVLRRE